MMFEAYYSKTFNNVLVEYDDIEMFFINPADMPRIIDALNYRTSIACDGFAFTASLDEDNSGVVTFGTDNQIHLKSKRVEEFRDVLVQLFKTA